MVTITTHNKDTISFDGRAVTITRPGGFMATHRKGQKQFPVSAIAGIQFKEPGMTVGFIQFTFGGEMERRRTGGTATDAVRDENAVVFNKRQLAEFVALRDAIQAAMTGPRLDHLPPPAMQPASAPSVADELTKLAGLRDAGVLTQDEFDAAKRRLLG